MGTDHGPTYLEALSYALLPSTVVMRAEKALAEIKSSSEAGQQQLIAFSVNDSASENPLNEFRLSG